MEAMALEALREQKNEGGSGAKFHCEESGVGGAQKRKSTQDFWKGAEAQGCEGRGELRKHFVFNICGTF